MYLSIYLYIYVCVCVQQSEGYFCSKTSRSFCPGLHPAFQTGGRIWQASVIPGFHSHGGTPNSWMVYFRKNPKWMMTGYIYIHVYIYICIYLEFFFMALMLRMVNSD